ncbi:MAG: aminoglycoside phosphotransferase family protein [Phycisphaerae bacterium]|nr:aminoglycoside phosphotransferase family protein [Phycisphaerae bacterium]
MTTERNDEPLVERASLEAPDAVPPTLGTPPIAPQPTCGSNSAGFRGSSGAPHALASALGHELLRAAEGRVSDVHWFRTDWQRGGAATATARYRGDDGVEHPIVVKVPVNPRELRWMRRLGAEANGPVARLWDSGDDLGAYDFAWLAIERVAHGPLALHWSDNHVQRIADAAARFHSAALATPVDQPVQEEDWEALVRAARERTREPSMPERNRWSNALKELSKKLDVATARWQARGPIGWIHGDLHPANAMTRSAEPDAPACLIDLAEVRAGHWLEDAIYFERLLWTRPDRLAARPVKAIAEARKRVGLENGDYPAIANARRVLLAGTTPAFRGEQSPAFLSASLAKLEECLHDIR